MQLPRLGPYFTTAYKMLHSLLSGSLALEALLIGVHCKKRYINVQIQYNRLRLTEQLQINTIICRRTNGHVDYLHFSQFALVVIAPGKAFGRVFVGKRFLHFV